MEIIIPKRFCGPQTSGNGGYSCGRLAAFVGGPAEITLRQPPPLDTPLRVERGHGTASMFHGAELIGEARAVPHFHLDVPSPPRWDEAVEASKGYNGLREHVYGTCFVCGPSRKPRDGLRIFCGPWKHGIVAGTWTPDSTLANGKGEVPSEIIWAAIDCPGSWSVIGRDDADAPVRGIASTLLLGRLTGRVDRGLRVGDECTVIGWFLGSEGRKYHVGTAVHTRAGKLVALSRATWIALKPA